MNWINIKYLFNSGISKEIKMGSKGSKIIRWIINFFLLDYQHYQENIKKYFVDILL